MIDKSKPVWAKVSIPRAHHLGIFHKENIMPMFPEKCDRCHQKLHSLTMSKFNTDIICDDCDDKERKHHKYNEASRIEADMVRNGIMNFKGIGKPSDL